MELDDTLKNVKFIYIEDELNKLVFFLNVESTTP